MLLMMIGLVIVLSLEVRAARRRRLEFNEMFRLTEERIHGLRHPSGS